MIWMVILDGERESCELVNSESSGTLMYPWNRWSPAANCLRLFIPTRELYETVLA